MGEHTVERPSTLYGKVEGDLGAHFVDVGVEAFLLVGDELVCEGCRRSVGGEEAQEAEESEEG